MFVKQRRYKLCLLLVVLGLTLSLVACGPEAMPQIWGLGDVSVDGVVDNADMDIIAQALGSRSGDANWNPEADLDLNGKVDVTDLAIAAVGTLIAGMSLRSPAGETLLPILLFPLLAPLLIAATRATSAALAGRPLGEWDFWLMLLVTFFALFVLAGTFIFDYISEQ